MPTPRKKRATTNDIEIELDEWLRRKTGCIQAYADMLNEIEGDWKEVLQQNHPQIWDEFVKQVARLSAITEGVLA